MPKRGDIRADGMVFVAYNKGSKDGEAWTSMESFLKANGQDWFERRARMDANVKARSEDIIKRKAARIEREAYMAIHGERLRAEKIAKDREYARVHAAKTRAENPEKRREYERQMREAKKDDPAYQAKRKAIIERFKGRARAASAARQAEREAIEGPIRAERERQKILAREARLTRIEENKRAKALVALTRKPKVVLTDEERKDRKRQDKRNYKHRRRAVLRGQSGKATAGQVREAKAKTKGICHYCRNKFKALTIDHVTPIAKGGSHTLDNIVFACHGCNSDKRDLPAHEWASKFGMLIV